MFIPRFTSNTMNEDSEVFPFTACEEVSLPFKYQLPGFSMYTTPDYFKGGITWNAIISLNYSPNGYTYCTGTIVCWPRKLQGRLDVKIKVSNTNSRLSAKQAGSWVTFRVTFNSESSSRIMSETQNLFSHGAAFPDQSSNKISVDIAWGCSFSKGLDTNLLLPSDPEYVIKKLEKLHSTQTMTDVVFVVGVEEVPAHRLILSAMSSVFKSMFGPETKETKTGRVEVDDSSAAGIKRMIRALYTSWEPDWTEMKDEDVLELVYLAHKYEIEPLLAQCEVQIIASLSVQNVCNMLKAAHTLHLVSAMDPIADFIKTHKEVLQSKDWKSLEEDHPSVAFKAFGMLLARCL